jgi:hypothetical protein
MRQSEAVISDSAASFSFCSRSDPCPQQRRQKQKSWQSGEVADAAGHIWRIQDLRETTVAVVFFTMFFASMLAALRLARDEVQAID